MAEKALEIPHKVAKIIDEVAKMVEVDYGTIVAMDQATNGIHGPSSEARDGPSEYVEEVIALPVRNGKTSRRYYPKVMKARRPAASSLKSTNGETYHSILEKFVPPKFKEELLQGVSNSIPSSSMPWQR